MVSQELLEQYELLTKSTGFVCLDDRSWLELTGNDRAAFLQNFCTADIQSLDVGQVTELFVLDTRGKIVGFGHVLALESSLQITVNGQQAGEAIREHLDKYIIRDDVEINDRTTEFATVFVCGPTTDSTLAVQFQTPANTTSQVSGNDFSATTANVEIAGEGILIAVPKEQLQALLDSLASGESLQQCSESALTMLRLERGTPWLVNEVDNNNLPQELRRDDKAISFTKGCYLGQETVAKIDAFGHVNKFLVGFQIDTDKLPERDAIITNDDAKTGVLKTTAYSPQLKSWLGLGYVKCKQSEPGTKLQIGSTEAKVVQLPLSG